MQHMTDTMANMHAQMR
jgi:hypothetical protein